MPSIIFWALNINKIIIPRTRKTKPGKPKKCAGLDKNLWKKIIENKHKSKVLDHSHRLVGNVQQQFRLTKEFLFTSGLEKQLNRIIESYYKNVIQVKPFSIKIDRAWIVRQFAGDFNPPHIHRGNVSGVCYLEVPNSIKYNKEIAFAGRLSFFDGRVSMPRNSPPLVKHRITFKPRVGDMYIFPAFLLNC